MINEKFKNLETFINQDIYKNIPKEHILNIFSKIILCRSFEENVKKLKTDNIISTLVYLSLGQESISAAISEVFKNCWVTNQHRNHSIYLNFGGNINAAINELLGNNKGSNKGMGGSPPLQDINNKIIGHNGLIGDQVPIACGVALKLKKTNEQIVCFLGDGAAEEDYVLASFGFASKYELPILFVCEDNDLSVLTPIKDRRNWKLDDVAKSFGLTSVNVIDDPWLVYEQAKNFKKQLPALINVKTCRELWHVGTGKDNEPEWNRFELIKLKLKELNLEKECNQIESEIKLKIDNLWKKQLQIL